MAAAATGPCCPDLDPDSVEEDAVFGGYKPATRMNRRDGFKLRIRKGTAADATSKRGPMVRTELIPSCV